MEKSLNESCPFGKHTTRFYSNLGKAPDLIESKEANLQIMRVLDKLAAEIKKRNPNWLPVPISEYNKIAEVSHKIAEHSPGSLKEVFPVSEERTVDYIFEKEVKPSNTTLGTSLNVAFLNKVNQQETKKLTAKYVMSLLQKKFSDFVKSDGKELDLNQPVVNQKAVKQGEGILISEKDFELLKNFQDLQERFESIENVKKLNSFTNITQIAEIILGIQISICKTLEELRKENQQWFEDNSIAFEEIAILDENNKIVPSSRLLKLIIHNIGEYLIQSNGSTSPETALFNALQEGLTNTVFHEKISIFQKTDKGIRFDGVVDKVCPARSALSQIIMNQLANRIIS